MMAPDEAVTRRCWECRHFGSSHDARLPYLCRVLGIKTRVLPSLEVLRVDGRACQGFTPKLTLVSSAPVLPGANDRGRVA
jgi:hypothetical protein